MSLKKLVFNLLLLFFITTSHEMNAMAYASWQAFKANGNMNVSKEAHKIFLSKCVKSPQEVVKAIVTNNPPTASTFEKSVSVISCVGSIVSGVGMIGKAGSYARSFFWPTEEEKLQKEQANLQLQILIARQELNKSLVQHAHAKRGNDGVPVPCKIVATRFAQVAGYDALTEILVAFNKFNKENAE